ncbi:MAG: hypothetical protein IPK13_24505 [Deltaproteobacteria bacterium]|nr:hypothetical protein [Deltaproteobacteria bacterium]
MKALDKNPSQTVLFTALASALWAPHCTANDDPSVMPLRASGPAVVGEQLVWVNHTTSQLIAIDPSIVRTPKVFALDQEIATAAFGQHEVLVLGRSRDDEVPVVDIVQFPSFDRKRISLFAHFNRLVMSKSGRSAILIHDISQTGDAPVVAQNQNEIAVVDLVNGTARRVLLDTESTTPRNVIFSPEDQQAAVVLDGAIVLVGLGSSTDRIKVPLKLPSGGLLLPERVEFAPDGQHLMITVSGTSEVIVMNIYNTDETLDGSLNFISVPGAATLLDIALPPVDVYDGHVAALFRRANGPGTIAAEFDVSGDASSVMPVELSGTASRIAYLENGMLLIHGAPTAWATYSGSSGAEYVAAWAPREGRRDEDLLAGPTLGPPVLGQTTAFFVHREGTSLTTTLTRVSLEASATRVAVELRPLVLGGVVKDYAADPRTGGILLGIDIPRANSGAAPPLFEDDEDAGADYNTIDPYATYPASEWIGDRTGTLTFVDPTDLAIRTLILDDPVERVGLVGDYVFAVHAGALGDVTIAPLGNFDRAHAVRYDGALLAGLLTANEVNL